MVLKLLQFPVPKHKVIERGRSPKAFEKNLVKGDEIYKLKELLLEDAIRDLPSITTDNKEDERDNGDDPRTDFQRNIRLPKHELMASANTRFKEYVMPKLYDHRPLKLSDRVCKIPKKKRAGV